jgi:hypothetical protein
MEGQSSFQLNIIYFLPGSRDGGPEQRHREHPEGAEEVNEVKHCQAHHHPENPHHRLNMELDLHSLFGLLCTAVLIG